uniref:HMG box domain-containing protein n=1 Tax=Trichobilharzia regenti TaxID=157069 RepID=A0AA85JIJ6_TRIRE|nr:unnamed protein product [Trichobilharzia regenti]
MMLFILSFLLQDSKSYYLQSPQNNFQSVRMSSKSDMRVPKPPKPPEKPLMPYMRYSRKVWEQVKNSNPHLKLWEVGKIIGQMWRELPDDEKMLYMEEYDAEKTQYTELLRQYHTSPAYQAWLLAKERAEKSMEEQDQERRQSILRSRDRGNEVPQGDLRESYILEDNEEDTEDQYTAKHVAAARFQRNHRLMLEVLSDARLPDPGQLITQSRLDMLRLQVEQLRNHKRNLCQEIDGCEARHQAKVQRIREESERFRLEYEKIKAGRPVITESQFADMIVKAKQDIQREEEDRKSRYLAELEMRRRRQQQRQQREAELLESERRRQLLQHHQQQQQQQQQQQLQQAHMRPAHPPVVHGDPNIQFTDRPLERLIVQDKREDASCQPTPSKLPATSTSLVNPVSGKGAASEVVHSGSGAVYPSGICNAFTQPANQNSVSRFPQSGHTQHHYPPPPHYIPSAVPPGNPTSLVHQRSPLPSIQQATPSNAAKANSTTPVNRTKKVASSGSSTSSASSASSTSSKKKKADCDVSKEATSQEMRERPTSSSGESVVDPNQMKSNDLANVTPGHSNEFQQGLSGQPRHVVASQYQPSNVPSNVVSSAQVSGAPVQAPYAYEVSMSNPSNPPPLPGGAYYPHHPPVTMSNPSGYSHARVQFSQHTPYNAMQYHHMPQQASSEQPQPPPPPPMYVQHMAQNAAPHVPQQPGTPVGGPNQHPPSHIPQAPPPPHQHNASNWHPAGASPYPAHYGPSRYPVPSGGGHVGYPPMQPPRNFGPNSGGYSSVPHYLVGQQNPQAHPHQNVPQLCQLVYKMDRVEDPSQSQHHHRTSSSNNNNNSSRRVLSLVIGRHNIKYLQTMFRVNNRLTTRWRLVLNQRVWEAQTSSKYYHRWMVSIHVLVYLDLLGMVGWVKCKWCRRTNLRERTFIIQVDLSRLTLMVDRMDFIQCHPNITTLLLLLLLHISLVEIRGHVTLIPVHLRSRVTHHHNNHNNNNTRNSNNNNNSSRHNIHTNLLSVMLVQAILRLKWRISLNSLWWEQRVVQRIQVVVVYVERGIPTVVHRLTIINYLMGSYMIIAF